MNVADLLVASGLAGPELLEELRGTAEGLEVEWGRICEVIGRRTGLSEMEILDRAGRLLSVEVTPEVPDTALDPHLVHDLPLEWVRENMMLPFRRSDGTVGVLFSDPLRLSLVHDVAVMLNTEVIPVLAPQSLVRRAIEQCYLRQERQPQDIVSQTESGETATSIAAPTDLLESPQGAPVTQMANLILLNAVRADASDIHIEPDNERLRVRYRIDGVLYDQPGPPRSMEAALISRLKVMAGLDIAEKRLPQDGAARVRVGDRELDLRVSCIPTTEGERVVLRILQRESLLLPLDALGMPVEVVERFRQLLHEPQGAIWVTGPTGSGKTTTLYAALRELDANRLNIVTIEDPVEYRLRGISQMAVKPKIGLTFATGLRHILRQDPDVILVGETRDTETAEIAVRASLTGHLVLSTLHTTSAAAAVIRLMDMGVPRYLLSSSVMAVLAQRLVRKLCPDCREPATVPAEAEFSPEERRQLELGTVFKPRGCSHCLEGYRGRTGIFEFLVVDDRVRELIRSGAGESAIVKAACENGMRTLWQEGIARVADGTTSLDEVFRAVGRRSGTW